MVLHALSFYSIKDTTPQCSSRQTRTRQIWAASSEFVSSSIPSWQISTAHAQPFRGARDLAFYLKVPLDSLLIWASSEGSGETARMRRLAWTFAARIGYKYQIRLTRSICIGIRSKAMQSKASLDKVIYCNAWQVDEKANAVYDTNFRFYAFSEFDCFCGVFIILGESAAKCKLMQKASRCFEIHSYAFP